MDFKNYTVTSFSESADGRKAQITVAVGKGRGSVSFTRHLEQTYGGWVGLNIDPRAKPLNERYGVELAEAKSNLASAKKVLESLVKELAVVEANEKVAENIIDAAMLDELRTELIEKMAEAQTQLELAISEADEACDKLSIIRRELPLMMEFNPYRGN